MEHETSNGRPDTIVAIERAGDLAVRLYLRRDAGVIDTVQPYSPWLITTSAAASQLRVGDAAVVSLQGDEYFDVRVNFGAWGAFLAARAQLREAALPFVGPRSIAEQYMMDTGATLFSGIAFHDLRRAQLDIETTGLDPHAHDARIVLITVSLNGERTESIRGDELSELEMIRALERWIRRTDPDVIEGHNIFNFDLPYIVERARRLRAPIGWGRDGSELRVADEQRFKSGPRTIPYRAAYVYGRHVIDTYQQAQRHDVGGHLESYALKPVIEALGLERSGRTHIDRSQIATAWERDMRELERYAVDDVLDVNALSELILPTEFYQCEIVPRTLQSVATGGTGEKVNDVLVGAYVKAGWSIPQPDTPRGYPGGYAELRRTGTFSPVMKCDVESLYPSIMLQDRIAPKSDHLGVFLPTLETLTTRRLQAKRWLESASGRDRAYWHGIQSSLKVLINSYYGYLGYSRGYFSDFDAAERVTLRGQEIIRAIVAELERHDALVIEVDTDGALIQPPSHVNGEAAERELVEQVGSILPNRIRLAHDGRYKGMLSLKLKNYALLEYDGRVVLKGSSLRSRREEPLFRAFLSDSVARLLDIKRYGSIRDFYLDVASRIQRGDVTIDEISRTESITEHTFTSEAGKRLAAITAGERVGERVQVYQRSDGTLARAEKFAGDEDRAYLLRRLRDVAARFKPLFEDDEGAFEYMFPAVSLDTNIEELRGTPRSTQLSLFG